jgi:hypothetical protein
MSSLYLVLKDNDRGGEGTVFTVLVNTFGKVKLSEIVEEAKT